MWTQAERRALRYIATGDYDRAIDEYRKLLSEVGDDPDIFNAIGDLYVKKRDFENAVNFYEKAVDLYRREGLTENAIAVARKALRYDPERKHLYLTLAELYSSIGRHDEAIGYLAAFLERGVKKEEFDMVIKSFKTVAAEVSKDMERLPRFERLFNKLQQIIEEVGERSLDEAEKEYAKTGRIPPAKPWPVEEEEYVEKYEKVEKEEAPIEEKQPPQPTEIERIEPEKREFTEEEIEKLAEFPSGEFEEELWKPAERPEPWERAVPTPPPPPPTEETSILRSEEQVEKVEWPPVEEAETPVEGYPPVEEAPPVEEVPPVEEYPPAEEMPPIEEVPVEREAIPPEFERPSYPEVEELVPTSEEVEKTLEEIIGPPEEKETPPPPTPPPAESVAPPPPTPEVPTMPPEAVERPAKPRIEKPKPTVKTEAEEVKREMVKVLTAVKDFIMAPTSLYFPDVEPFELGFILLDMGLYEAAIAHFQLGLDDDEKRLIALKMSALAFLKWGKIQLAVRQLKKAMEIEDDIEIHYILGQCYEALGRPKDALREYEEVFLRNLDYKDVAERISRLYASIKRS